MLGGIGPAGGRRRLGLVAVAVAMTLAACTTSQPSGSGPTVPGMSCAWPTELDPQADNSLKPGSVSVDSNEVVWMQPIVASAGTRIVLSGRFPDARYASFSVYTSTGGQVTGGTLEDYRIVPQSGSVNPWQRESAPGGSFTVTIAPDPSPGQANTLPMPPGATSRAPGRLVYRVYAPVGGDFSAVPLPVLTVDQARTLPACARHDNVPPGLVGPPSTTSTRTPGTAIPPQLGFFTLPPSKLSSEGVANADTSYAVAYLVRPPAGDVVVITGKAPTFAPGSHPSPWPSPGEDVRYWSMCVLAGTRMTPTIANVLPGGATDYGCRDDAATGLDAAGDYTYVLGTESQRAAIGAVPGVTFLPFAAVQSTPLYLLMLRDMLVSPSFANSPRDVTRADDPAATSAVMGPYYPRAVVCSLTSLTTTGPGSCRR